MATNPPAEPLELATVKDYLRVLDSAEDSKIAAMIPRARLWVEEHTGIAILKRAFVEQRSPRAGIIRLSRGPLVSLDAVGYVGGDGADQTFDDAVASPPSTKLSGAWPSTGDGTPFTLEYTAGLWTDPEPPEQVDDRLLGAMLALIEGEYTAGFAYPDDALTAATNCLFYMKFVAP